MALQDQGWGPQQIISLKIALSSYIQRIVWMTPADPVATLARLGTLLSRHCGSKQKVRNGHVKHPVQTPEIMASPFRLGTPVQTL